MSEEMLEKLRNAESAEEIVSIAKEYGREVTAEQAQELLDRLKAGASEGELSDDLLEAVAGGGYHRYRQGVVWKPFRQVIRRAAPTESFGMQAGRRVLVLRAADAGRGHVVCALDFMRTVRQAENLKNSPRKEKISNKIRRSTYQSMRAAILPE